jgi:hypothetical protein
VNSCCAQAGHRLCAWAIVQLAPSIRGAALLNDGAIVHFVADLEFVLIPGRLTEQ